MIILKDNLDISIKDQTANQINRIMKKFGMEAQREKFHEELTELSLAEYHYHSKKVEKEDLITEMADVLIMMEQLANYYDIKEDEIRQQVGYKLNRTLQFIKQKG